MIDAAASSMLGMTTRAFFRTPSVWDEGRRSDDLFLFTLWLSVVMFVLLMGVMGYYMWKYRRRPGVAAQPSASHNTRVELVWTILPMIPLTYIFFEGFRGYLSKLVAPANAIEISLTAKQWSWEALYANGATATHMEALDAKRRPDGVEVSNEVTYPVIVVPYGVPVAFKMHSNDVIHSFWVPDMRTKFDVFPNRYTSIWFIAEADNWKPEKDADGQPKLWKQGKGEYEYQDHWIFCAEFCGQNHSEMAGILRVVRPEKFREIIDSFLIADDAPLEEWGRYLYVKYGCNACHSLGADTIVGPGWATIYGFERKFTDGTSIPAADEAYIRESILVPASKIVAGFPNRMTTYQGVIKPDHLDKVIEYIKRLSPNFKPLEDLPPAGAGSGGAGSGGGSESGGGGGQR